MQCTKVCVSLQKVGQMTTSRASSAQSQTFLIFEDPPCYFQDSDYDVHDDLGYGDGPRLRDYDK